MHKFEKNILLILWLAFMSAINVYAQCSHFEWVKAPNSINDNHHVLFKRTILSEGQTRKAWLSVASDGVVDVYVNGMNVSSDVMLHADGGVEVTTFNVSGFMRADTNVVAVYSEKRRIAASLCVEYNDGKVCRYDDAESWVCQEAASMRDSCGHECFDNRKYYYEWSQLDNEQSGVMAWLPAEPMDSFIAIDKSRAHYYDSFKIATTIEPRYFNIEGDTVIYNFDRSFIGWVRVTLRGCKRGERIKIGGLEYICNGTMDEQACSRFSTEHVRQIAISGDRRFRREQIQQVEGLGIVRYKRNSYRY